MNVYLLFCTESFNLICSLNFSSYIFSASKYFFFVCVLWLVKDAAPVTDNLHKFSYYIVLTLGQKLDMA